MDNVHPVSDFECKEIDQVFIGTCTNGRLEDLDVAARIIGDRKVKARTSIIPISREVRSINIQPQLLRPDGQRRVGLFGIACNCCGVGCEWLNNIA